MVVASFFAATLYTVYLLHMLILMLRPNAEASIEELALYLAALFALAAVFYRTIKKPIFEARPSYGISAPVARAAHREHR